MENFNHRKPTKHPERGTVGNKDACARLWLIVTPDYVYIKITYCFLLNDFSVRSPQSLCCIEKIIIRQDQHVLRGHENMWYNISYYNASENQTLFWVRLTLSVLSRNSMSVSHYLLLLWPIKLELTDSNPSKVFKVTESGFTYSTTPLLVFPRLSRDLNPVSWLQCFTLFFTPHTVFFFFAESRVKCESQGESKKTMH